MKHPIQPLVTDEQGTVRFKANSIVNHLLDNGGINMNDIAVMNFSKEDREQFAQLIGYSWSGACDLSYMSEEVLDAAKYMHETGTSEAEARAGVLREKINRAKDAMRNGVAELFGVHPDDLT